jgi:hypothetical protein
MEPGFCWFLCALGRKLIYSTIQVILSIIKGVGHTPVYHAKDMLSYVDSKDENRKTIIGTCPIIFHILSLILIKSLIQYDIIRNYHEKRLDQKELT